MDIDGSKILVTGASGGLGIAITRELARRGAKVTITARNVAQLEALARETGAEVVVADLSDRSDLDRLCSLAEDMDVVVANAGTGGDVPVAEADAAHVDFMIDVNLRSPILLATAFAQAKLKNSARGQIVTIGSLSGITASPETRMYNATKFGLRGFSLALRQDLDAAGIGVTVVEPGFIRDAGMFANSEIELPKGVRTKSPQDVADAVVKAIESNPAEIFVAPVEMRVAATLGSVAPGLSEMVQRRVGAGDMKRGAAATS